MCRTYFLRVLRGFPCVFKVNLSNLCRLHTIHVNLMFVVSCGIYSEINWAQTHMATEFSRCWFESIRQGQFMQFVNKSMRPSPQWLTVTLNFPCTITALCCLLYWLNENNLHNTFLRVLRSDIPFCIWILINEMFSLSHCTCFFLTITHDLSL